MTDRIFIGGLDDDEQATLDVLHKQLEDKQPRNLLRASYYDGRRAIRQVGSLIPPQYYRLAFVLGWSGKSVDSLARRCNLDGIVWPGGDLDSLGMSEVWDENQLEAEVDSAMISSLIHAVSFLVTTKGDVAAGEPAALIHVKDAMNATGTWNTRRRRLDNLLSITSRDAEGKPTGLALYLDNLTITADRDENGSWHVDRQEHPWGVPAEPLVYKPRVGRPFGTSRISRPVMSIHDAALRTVIRMEGHADVFSFPEMWLLGADESVFKNADGSLKASWQVMLGRIKGIPDDEEASQPRADVKQFQASSPEPHLAQLNALAKLFARETSLPDSSFAITDMANPTAADAYSESREDLIAEAEGATRDWRRPLQRAVLTALAIKNDLDEIPAEWSTIAPKWRPPIYVSKSAQADAGGKQLAAVPWLAETEVGLELLGLDEQQIRRALSERRRLDGRGVLKTLMEAAQQQVDADAV